MIYPFALEIWDYSFEFLLFLKSFKTLYCNSFEIAATIPKNLIIWPKT